MHQRTDEWYAAKAGKFSASRFGDLMAKTKSGPSASRKNLITRIAIERLTGRYLDTYTNAAMLRGIELEPEALAAYENRELVAVEPAGFLLHPEFDFVGCSPDGLIAHDGLVEVKCPSAEAKHYEALRHGAHAQEYRWQLQGQMWVTCRLWVDAVSYDPRFPPPLRLAVTRVLRDEDAIDELRAECLAAESEVAEQLGFFNALLQEER